MRGLSLQGARLPRHHRPDYFLALIVFILCLIGLVMVFSASVIKSYAETDGTTLTKYLFHQFVPFGLGIVAWAISYRIDYPHWRRLGPKLFFLTVILLVMVLISGTVAGGAQRWLSLGPLSLQPTELVKISFILYLALWFERRLSHVNSLNVFLSFCALLGGLALLVLLQPNLSTTLIIAAAGVAIYFVAGANSAAMVSLLGGGFLAVLVLIKTASYRMARLLVFLNPDADPTGIGYQIKQALIAVGNGGFFGVGFNLSRQKFNYLPEAATDAIFPVIAEELGYIRVMLILMLYLALVVKGYRLAKKAPDAFGRFIAVGISTWFLVQIFINIGAMISIVPLTGVPLIFISFGGSSLLFSLFSVGILLNISKYTKEEAIHAHSGSGRGDWRSYLPNFGSRRRARKTRY